MILSDKNLKERIIKDHKKAEQAKGWWKKSEWDNIGNKIVIDLFKAGALGVCSYDLSVGEEYRSLRDPRTTKQLNEGESIRVGPGESVLILTEEYVCLPKNVLAIIVPRARWIFEGTSICATRIDPTWYGKLLVGFTNLAKYPVELYRQEAFCTCYFMEALETETVLTKDKVHFLGRTKIGRIDFSHATEQRLMPADKVKQEDMEKIVDLYGWPWDVVRGMFILTLKEITEYVEKEVAPAIVEDATSAAITRAFENQQKWIRNLIIGLLTIGAGLICLVGYLIYLVLSRP